MQPNNQTAFVLADNEAPFSNGSGYGKIGSKRSEMLSEAHDIISKMTEKQFNLFIEMLRKELQ